MRETVIREEMKRLGGKLRQRRRADGAFLSGGAPPLCYDEETLLLSAVIAFPEKMEHVLQTVPIEEFRNPTVRSIFERLRLKGKDDSLDSILPSFGDGERRLVSQLAVQPGFDLEIADRNIEDCLRKVAQRRFD